MIFIELNIPVSVEMWFEWFWKCINWILDIRFWPVADISGVSYVAPEPKCLPW